MVDILPTSSVHFATRAGFTANQQKGILNGIQIRGGVVQDATTDINFDLRSGTLNPLIAKSLLSLSYRDKDKRTGILSSKATIIRHKTVQFASDQLGDFTGVVFQNLLNDFKDQQKRKRLTSADARDLVEQYFDDPSLQHAAILAIANMERQMAENDDLHDMLQKLAQTLMEEQGPAIRAGYNINNIVALFARDNLNTFQALREAYRATLLSDMGEDEIYNFLVHVFPLRLRHLILRKQKKLKDQKKKKPAWEDWEDGEDS